jgi:tetratricopeptide (TPR) repeat protein
VRRDLAISPKVGMVWFLRGYARHAQKRYDEALADHLEAAKYPEVKSTALYNAACVHSLKGHADEAFAYLEKSVAAGFADASTLRSDTDLANIQSDPRFDALVSKLEKRNDDIDEILSFPPTQEHRLSTRLFLYSRKNGGFQPEGQVHVDYGTLAWRAEFAGAIESERFQGVRWRLGKNFWTSLDTNVPLTIGGVEIEPGLYYLSLMRKKDGGFELGLHDPAKVREAKADAFQLTFGSLQPEHHVAMKHEELEEVAEELTLSIQYEKDPKHAEFFVDFGPHRVSCALDVRI